MICKECEWTIHKTDVIDTNNEIVYTTTTFTNSKGEVQRIEQTYPMKSDYLFMIGIRQSMRTLAVTQNCRQGRKLHVSEQLVRKVCALAQQLGKRYIIVDTPIGAMPSILQKTFGAVILDRVECRRILSRSIHLENSSCFQVYRLDVKIIIKN